MRLDRTDRKIAVFLISVVTLTTLVFSILFFNKDAFAFVKNVFFSQKNSEVIKIVKPKKASSPVTNEAIKTPENVPSETKKTISKEPPKHPEKSEIAASTTRNTDGSETTVISAGGAGGTAELNQIATLGPSGSSPYSIRYVDETGNYSAMEGTLKDYLNNQLRWGGEVNYLYKITVRNAGDTGWEGQYSGSYTVNSSGDVVSAFGYIILNVYYHKDSPQFVDYMKLVLSHEYGHHYTLYHKWVDLDLKVGTRFPNSYYSVRPLSISTTAPDYSLGWNNCDSEIIAEDYAYLYSGYGYHAMNEVYGYPSSETKTWLDTLTSQGGSGASLPAPVPSPTSTTTPAEDTTPPSVSITEPAASSTLTGTVLFKASASDNVGITKVGFYVNASLVIEDTTSPYETQINTEAYSNGAYTLKAVAYDNSLSTESSLSVTIANNQPDTEKPVASIINPLSSLSDWTTGDLIMEARATDNISVVKMEFYANDEFLSERIGDYIGIRVRWFDGYPGEYIFKVKAYDAAGNIGETTTTILKQ